MDDERRKGAFAFFDDHLDLRFEEIGHKLLVFAGDECETIGILHWLAVIVKLVGFDFASEEGFAFVTVEMPDDRLGDLSLFKRFVEFKVRKLPDLLLVRVHSIH